VFAWLDLFTLLLKLWERWSWYWRYNLVPSSFFLILFCWWPCSSFLAALLLLACWPAPSASLGDPGHWLLLLGSCDGILWWTVLGVLEIRWMVKWCWWVCEVRLLVLAMCLYTSTDVKTAHDMHVVTVLLTGGQIGFLYLWRQATVVDDYHLWSLFCTANWISHWLRIILTCPCQVWFI
jgi:hypothetical protein